MVLQRPVVAGLLLLAACGKPSTSPTEPPDPNAETTPEPEATPEPDRVTTAHEPTDPPPSEDEEEILVDGVTLRLHTTQCQLRASFLDERRTHQFEDFPGACHFGRDARDAYRIVETDNGKAVIVESSVPDQGRDCDTALQVVVVTEKGPELSREIQRVAMCAPAEWDEMMFHVLSSDRVAFGG